MSFPIFSALPSHPPPLCWLDRKWDKAVFQGQQLLLEPRLRFAWESPWSLAFPVPRKNRAVCTSFHSLENRQLPLSPAHPRVISKRVRKAGLHHLRALSKSGWRNVLETRGWDGLSCCPEFDITGATLYKELDLVVMELNRTALKAFHGT